ncbi:GPI-anchored cell wall organization protein ecm33 [Xylariaceae sp. FL0594]|nr:GPI-anchored cell wall organization protein ecm33 [Xylariaceae sp. FL0594]
MYTKELLAAVAAFGLFSGAAAVGCKDDPVKINNQADADQISKCKSVDNDIVLDANAGPAIDLGGSLTEIKGSLIVKSNGYIQTLQSSSLQTIGNIFQLQNVTTLNSVIFPKLGEVGSIDWSTLPRLPEPTFGTPGITKANSVSIQDTFIQNLNGINVQEVTDLMLANNRRLTKFSSSIKTLSNVMVISANGLDLDVEVPNLQWIANMTIANVSSFSIPSLHTVNGSMRFDSNYFDSFIAPNLTEFQDGDLSFVSNPKLTNISFPQLEKIGGGMTIANNTQLEKIDGFNSLKEIGGAIIMRGSFDSIDLPALEDVVGTAQFISTGNITESCDKLNEYSGGVIQGKITRCKGGDAGANNDTSGAPSGDDGDNGSGNDNDHSAASLAGVSMPTLVSLASVAGLVAMFL